MHKNRHNLQGRRFGLLTVTGIAPDIQHGRKTDSCWHCACDCGRMVIRRSRVLLRGDNEQSCGCFATKALIERSTTHNLSFHPLFGVWRGMRKRCNNPKHEAYDRYGGRGIKVCERWQNSFEAFLADMGTPPFGMTLDRVDTNGHYEPGNCRWATRKTQGENSRSTVWVTLYDERMTLTDAATILGTNRGNLRRYANQNNLTIQQAVEQWRRLRNRFIFRKIQR